MQTRAQNYACAATHADMLALRLEEAGSQAGALVRELVQLSMQGSAEHLNLLELRRLLAAQARTARKDACRLAQLARGIT